MSSNKRALCFLFFLFCSFSVYSQKILTLHEAMATAVENYPSIKAKGNYTNASRANLAAIRKEGLPNLVVSAQQDWGTINGQNGPAYGLGGFGVASSGLPLPDQNWNAAFGALYLTNFNWDIFAFGRLRERIKTAEFIVNMNEMDEEQELFQHQVRVASAYLNLLAAQRITRSQQYNLARADTIRYVVAARAKGGLIAGVDSSLANAEVSNARSAFINARDVEQERANNLSLLMGVTFQDILTDTLFISKIPAVFSDTVEKIPPVLQFYQLRKAVSDQQLRFINTLRYPTVSFFSVLQARASGFAQNYASDQTAFSHNFYEGIKPSRTNYLFGLGITWNLTSWLRVNEQVRSQAFNSRALQDEYNLVNLQVKAQRALAETKIANAIANYNEAPLQVKAAQDAYLQKYTLYKNGLSSIIDVTQTLYTLNRAETNRDVAYNNIWQALLLKAAATGDLNLFTSQIR